MRLIINKFEWNSCKKEVIEFRKLKVQYSGKETNVYVIPDRTVLQIKIYKRLRKEMKEKQAITDKHN